MSHNMDRYKPTVRLGFMKWMDSFTWLREDVSILFGFDGFILRFVSSDRDVDDLLEKSMANPLQGLIEGYR